MLENHRQVECSLARRLLVLTPTSPFIIRLFQRLPTLCLSLPRLRAQSCHSVLDSLSFSSTSSTRTRSSSRLHSEPSASTWRSVPGFSLSWLLALPSKRWMSWKSERSSPKGSCSGEMRARFGVDGACGDDDGDELCVICRASASSSASVSMSVSSLLPMSSSSSRRRLLTPLGGAGGVRFAILFLVTGVSSPLLSDLLPRARRRSFIGVGAYERGGVGSCVSVGAGASAPWSLLGAVMVMRDWRERQVFMILSIEYCADSVVGLEGGDTNRPVCDLVVGAAREPSQEKADGRSMLD